MPAMFEVTAHKGDTIDALCWRHLGRTAGVTEQAIALNPGLAAAGPILTEGQAIILPAAADAAPSIRETVNLWD